jgi:hypothetical protein
MKGGVRTMYLKAVLDCYAGNDQLNNVAAVAWRGLDAKEDEAGYTPGLGDMASNADEDDSR